MFCCTGARAHFLSLSLCKVVHELPKHTNLAWRLFFFLSKARFTYLDSSGAKGLEHSVKIFKKVLVKLGRRLNQSSRTTNHWHTVVLVERLIRHRWRIDCWHTWRIDCRKLLDWDVVDGRRGGRGCVVHGTVRCTDCL